MIKSKNQNLYFYCFHKFQPFLSFWLFMSLSLIPIHLFKNLSTVHNFLPCSLCNSFRSSIYLFFLISMASLLFFLLSLSLSLFLLSQGHMKQKNGGQRHGGRLFRPELGLIGHFSAHFCQNWPELALIGANLKTQKKKKPTQHGHTVSSIAHHTPRRCTSGVGAVALELHLCFLGSDTYWTQ